MFRSENIQATHKVKFKPLQGIKLFAYLGIPVVAGCGGGGGSQTTNTSPSSLSTPVTSNPLAAAIAVNSTNFYNPTTLQANLPDLPANPAAFAATPYNSYKNTSIKGNDAWSTKRLDLVAYYNAIRYGDSSYFKEYTGTTPVFVELPNWTIGQYNIGVLSKQWQTNALDFYNFARALSGMQWVYMSGYKQVAAQAASMSNLPGGHSPQVSDGAAVGITGAFFNAVGWGRGAGCLMGGNVNKTMNYAALTSFPVNSKLMSIWNESESGNVAGMGHRNAFLYPAARDIGIGAVGGFYTWVTYGADPSNNNGQLLGAASQSATFNSWPVGQASGGVWSWPSHGYFPFFMWNGVNQAWSTKLPSSSVTAPTAGETITLKMEYFVHAQDGDLALLVNPQQTLTLSAVVGNPAGGAGPDYSGAEQIPSGGTGPQYVQGGGYYFTVNGSGGIPYEWRMPQNWYANMATDFASATPSYHTVRFTFASSGAGFKVKTPFYMNPTVGAPLVIQTTFFDIKKQAN